MNIALFYGGKSSEHEISVATAKQVYAVIKKQNVKLIYITPDGKWVSPKNITDRNGARVTVRFGENKLRVGAFSTFTPDVALLCNHGAYGEDGCLQGILQSCNIPYTGSGVTASAIGLNKSVAKRVFTTAGLPQVTYFTASSTDSEQDVIKTARKIGYPLIVKPNCLGSSIGIAKVSDDKQLTAALAAAFMWDDTAVIERALENFSELNCAVIASKPSEVERPARLDEILSYADKYERGAFSGTSREFPAAVDQKTYKKAQRLAVKAYEAIGASGVARVDFLLSDSGELFVNEINTIPGSLAMYLFNSPSGGSGKACGKTGKISGESEEMIALLLSEAIKSHTSREQRKYSYISTLKIIDETV